MILSMNVIITLHWQICDNEKKKKTSETHARALVLFELACYEVWTLQESCTGLECNSSIKNSKIYKAMKLAFWLIVNY